MLLCAGPVTGPAAAAGRDLPGPCVAAAGTVTGPPAGSLGRRPPAGPRGPSGYVRASLGSGLDAPGANAAAARRPAGEKARSRAAPSFLRPIWFMVICLGLAGLAIGLVCFLHRRRAAERIRAECEDRAHERDRMARELSDGLLQGFQGLTLRFQAVADRIPPDQALRPIIDEVLERADAVLVEGRQRVRELPGAPASTDLPGALSGFASALFAAAPERFGLIVRGRPRDLRPKAREAVLRIGEAAIRDASGPGEPARVEVMLCYGAGRLTLTVRGHRPGRGGRPGMRERVREIGGSLTVTGRGGAGTKVRLSIPAGAAYAGARAARPFWPWRPPKRRG